MLSQSGTRCYPPPWVGIALPRLVVVTSQAVTSRVVLSIVFMCGHSKALRISPSFSLCLLELIRSATLSFLRQRVQSRIIVAARRATITMGAQATTGSAMNHDRKPVLHVLHLVVYTINDPETKQRPETKQGNDQPVHDPYAPQMSPNFCPFPLRHGQVYVSKLELVYRYFRRAKIKRCKLAHEYEDCG